MSVNDELTAVMETRPVCSICQYLTTLPAEEQQEFISAFANPAHPDLAFYRILIQRGHKTTMPKIKEHRAEDGS